MQIAAFYYLWADGPAWRIPAVSYASALCISQFPAMPAVALSGSPDNRVAAAAWLDSALPGWHCLDVPGDGHEGHALAALRRWCLGCPEPAAVLYCHSKGARSADDPYRHARREELTRHLVSGWRYCVSLLSCCDAAGCSWMWAGASRTRRAAGASVTMVIEADHFSGNFWWARSDYLARLPEPSGDRFDAEIWIGLGRPRAADLAPGWPY